MIKLPCRTRLNWLSESNERVEGVEEKSFSHLSNQVIECLVSFDQIHPFEYKSDSTKRLVVSRFVNVSPFVSFFFPHERHRGRSSVAVFRAGISDALGKMRRSRWFCMPVDSPQRGRNRLKGRGVQPLNSPLVNRV